MGRSHHPSSMASKSAKGQSGSWLAVRSVATNALVRIKWDEPAFGGQPDSEYFQVSFREFNL